MQFVSLQRLKPEVNKAWLFAVAGLMWSAAGVMLIRLAYGWLRSAVNSPIFLLASLGVLLAMATYRFGFSKFADKNIQRIHELAGDQACIFAFQEWTSYPLVVFMISLGIVLRRYSPIPKPLLAVAYLGIGGSLFLASFHYYRQLGNQWSGRQNS